MDDNTHKIITVVLGVGAAISGIIALMTYLEDKKLKGIKEETLQLEHDLKLIQIEKAKGGSYGGSGQDVIQLYS